VAQPASEEARPVGADARPVVADARPDAVPGPAAELRQAGSTVRAAGGA